MRGTSMTREKVLDSLLDSMLDETHAKIAGLQTELEVQKRIADELAKRKRGSEASRARPKPKSKWSRAPKATPKPVANQSRPTASAESNGSAHRPQVNLIVEGSLAAHIVEILRKAENPKRGTDIAAELRTKGVKAAESLPSVLSALRRRKDLFENVRRGFYKLKHPDI
jgi:hypothetical protein